MGLNSASRLSSEGEFCVCRNLQQTLSDSSLLRSMTGEWFYQSKQLRHQDRIHGTDIIRASIRQTQRPPTLSESVATPAQGGVRGVRETRNGCWEQQSAPPRRAAAAGMLR